MNLLCKDAGECKLRQHNYEWTFPVKVDASPTVLVMEPNESESSAD
jgi:hypothetical protein